MHAIVNIAVKAARAAGDIIVRAAQRTDELQLREKDCNEFATQIDDQAERCIIDIIRKAYPTHGILAEEGGFTEGDEYQWIIDPLDGTTNFIHGFPHHCVSIAVKCNGRLEHGVIYDAMRNDLFTASRGQGAQCNQYRMRVSKRDGLTGSLLGTGFPYRNQDQLDFYLETFKTFFGQAAGIRRAGSAALDLAYVAAGYLDGFWEIGLKQWDIAAGVLMIREAGGLITDFDGGESYLDNGNVIAANPKICKQMLKIIHNTIL